ncbi:MAG: C40 family peptidase, partial [Acetatifactor sp.]|nr:C40 family peptidase [Acetatifactor sp.]
IDDYVTRYAVVAADRLNVREAPDMGAKRLAYIDTGERLQMLEDQGEWLKVQYTEGISGYVASEYVTIMEEFVYAKTLEEEARELAERRALEARQNVTEQEASENTVINVTPPSGVYATNEELRSQIVDYAMQFLGNVYIHGGKTLEGGTDCSGFTSLIYAEFGYSISRTPAGQLSNAGRSISYSEIQPGDIICYGSKGKCTHVAMYIGDGQIIHSANPRKGVVIYKADYDTILGVKNLID